MKKAYRVFMLLLAAISSSVNSDTFYDVHRVAADDTLSQRTQASSTSDILGLIPANARFLSVTGQEKIVGKSTWVKLHYLQRSGWVNKHYLVPSATAQFTTLNCVGTEPFWSFDIQSGKVILRDLDENETFYALASVNPSINHTNRWILRGAAHGTTDLVVALWKTGSCSDGMTERNYQYEIMYHTPASKTLSGCCNVIDQ